MLNVEYKTKDGEWKFRTFPTNIAADVFAKNVELQGGTVLFCGNPRDVLAEPTWDSVTMNGRFSCE